MGTKGNFMLKIEKCISLEAAYCLFMVISFQNRGALNVVNRKDCEECGYAVRRLFDLVHSVPTC